MFLVTVLPLTHAVKCMFCHIFSPGLCALFLLQHLIGLCFFNLSPECRLDCVSHWTCTWRKLEAVSFVFVTDKADILASHSRESKGVSDDCFRFRQACSRVLILLMSAHWHCLLWHLMELSHCWRKWVLSVLFLLWLVKTWKKSILPYGEWANLKLTRANKFWPSRHIDVLKLHIFQDKTLCWRMI